MHQEDRCLEAETVRLLMAERLAPRELARAARHLGACRKCRDYIVIAAGGVAGSADGNEPARGAREPSARAPGDIVGQKYRLTSILGGGKYSSVWRAERLDWRAPVALKLLVAPLEESEEFSARFQREVRLAAALRSPNVVQVLDHGLDEATGQAFIALELLEGETLDARLQREGRLTPAVTVGLLEHVVRAVERAHSLGIIHRDLKPANIFILRDFDREVVKVLDFGVAKLRKGQGILTMVTAPGTVLGTPYYMSPEQIRASKDLDHHADLWALAVIACECLTGRKPFVGKNFFEISFSVVNESKRPVPSELGPSPSGFDAWFERATHLDRRQRFPTARHALDALQPICAGGTSNARRQETSRSRTDQASEQATRVARFSKYFLFAAALGVSAGLWFHSARRTQDGRPGAQQPTAATLSLAATEVGASPPSSTRSALVSPARELRPVEPQAASPESIPPNAPVQPAQESPSLERSAVSPQPPAARPTEHRTPERAQPGAPRARPGRPISGVSRSGRPASGRPRSGRPAAPPEARSAREGGPVDDRPVRIDLTE
jgi:eukaryotic-like serine/threonine-protein kinase